MNRVNILFTSVGRRVALVQLFRDALDDLGVAGTIVTADMQSLVPARFTGDVHETVPAVCDSGYVDRLIQICQEHDINLLVPLIDTELLLLARNNDRFAELGVTLLSSSEAVTEITIDKRRTHDFFVANGIVTPRVYPSDYPWANGVSFPVMLKPALGSGSIGVVQASNLQELEFHFRSICNPIVQEYVTGDEYTLDILVDLAGKVRSVVPRKRLEVRAGEMSKGVTVKHSELIAEGVRIAELLPGARGPITLQCFLTDDGTITSIEINPRFGGGFPLSAAAGANFPRWIIEWVLGRDPEIGLTDWVDGLHMLRYDEAHFTRWEAHS